MSPATTLPPRPRRLDNTVAFVTGASRGIGAGIAKAYASEGADLILAATNRELLATVASECRQLSGDGKVMVHVLDVADRNACVASVKQAEQQFGRVDVLVNAAGIYKASAFLDYQEQDFRKLLDVNLFGTMFLMQAVLPGMIARNQGRIVNIASTAGKWASPGQSAYNVSKHAVVGLTRCVAQEMGAHQIAINAICPGLVNTDMLTGNFGRSGETSAKPLNEVLAPVMTRIAMKRVLEVDEIAGMAVYLGSKESSGMTGQSIVIDGGMLYT